MRCSGACVLNTTHATRTGSSCWILSVRSLASLIGHSLQRRANQISRLAAMACSRTNFQSDFQILRMTNSLQGASHALLASLGSCARRVGCCGVSLPLFLGSPGCYFPLDIPSTISYYVCKRFVKMHLSLKGLHLTDETRRSTRCLKNRKSLRSPPRDKLCPFASVTLSLPAWSGPSNSCPRKRATVFRLRRLPSSSLSLPARTALKLRT